MSKPEEASSVATAAAVSSDDSASSVAQSTPLLNSVASFTPTPGRSRHCITGDEMSVDKFGRMMAGSSVYRLFYAYSTMISKDAVKARTVFDSNQMFNRYLDVPCYDENRVVLQNLPPESNYIHASFCDGFEKAKKYICAQAPLASTIDRFWEMCWQEKVTTILAMYVPSYYFPVKSGDTVTHGPYTVLNQGTRNARGTYDATVVLVTKGGESRTIVHFEYFDWPRFTTPGSTHEILHLLVDLRYNHEQTRAKAEKEGWMKGDDVSPILVHCATGAGRSGTIIALDIICDKLDKSNKIGTAVLDVTDTVSRLRSQRAMAVQKPEQFVVLNFLALEYALRMKYFQPETASNLNMVNYYLYPEDGFEMIDSS